LALFNLIQLINSAKLNATTKDQELNN